MLGEALRARLPNPKSTLASCIARSYVQSLFASVRRKEDDLASRLLQVEGRITGLATASDEWRSCLGESDFGLEGLRHNEKGIQGQLQDSPGLLHSLNRAGSKISHTHAMGNPLLGCQEDRVNAVEDGLANIVKAFSRLADTQLVIQVDLETIRESIQQERQARMQDMTFLQEAVKADISSITDRLKKDIGAMGDAQIEMMKSLRTQCVMHMDDALDQLRQDLILQDMPKEPVHKAKATAIVTSPALIDACSPISEGPSNLNNVTASPATVFRMQSPQQPPADIMAPGGMSARTWSARSTPMVTPRIEDKTMTPISFKKADGGNYSTITGSPQSARREPRGRQGSPTIDLEIDQKSNASRLAGVAESLDALRKENVILKNLNNDFQNGYAKAPEIAAIPRPQLIPTKRSGSVPSLRLHGSLLYQQVTGKLRRAQSIEPPKLQRSSEAFKQIRAGSLEGHPAAPTTIVRQTSSTSPNAESRAPVLNQVSSPMIPVQQHGNLIQSSRSVIGAAVSPRNLPCHAVSQFQAASSNNTKHPPAMIGQMIQPPWSARSAPTKSLARLLANGPLRGGGGNALPCRR